MWDRLKQKTDMFVGRENVINKIKKLYFSDKELKLANVYGVGGIGKSTLIDKLNSEFSKKTFVIKHDFAQENNPSAYEFYSSLFDRLKASKKEFIYFQMAFVYYWQKRNKNIIEAKEDFPTYIQESDLFGDIFNALFSVKDSVKDIVPVATGVSKVVYKGIKYLINKYRLDDEVMSQFAQFKELDSLKDMENFLAYFFYEDLRRLKDFKPVVLIDSYEKLYEDLNISKTKEIQEWVKFFAYSLKDYGLLVIAGREPIKWEESSDIKWSEIIEKVELNSLSKNESFELLESNEIKDEKLKSYIFEITKGYPFYLKLAIDLYKRDKNGFNLEEKIDHVELLDRFIGNLSYELRVALEYLSIPKTYNEELFEYLAKSFNLHYDSLFFKKITSYSFVFKVEDKFFIHDVMRNALQKVINKKRLLEIHGVLFNYYNEKLKDNQNYYFEALFHLSKFKSEEELLKWILSKKGRLYRLGLYDILIRMFDYVKNIANDNEIKALILKELGTLYVDLKDLKGLNEVLEEFHYVRTKNREIIDNYKFFEIQRIFIGYEKKGIQFNKKKIIKKLNSLRDTTSNDLKAKVYIELGNFFRKLKRIYFALNYLNKALQYSNDDLTIAKVYDKFGYFYRDNKEYEKAQNYFIKALNIKRNFLKNHIEIAKSFRGLFIVYIKQGKIELGLKAFMEMIDIFKDFYGKFSRDVITAYEMIENIIDEKWIVKNGMDLDLYLFIRLKKALQKREDIDNILEKLEEIGDDNRLFFEIAFLFYKNNEKFSKYIDLALMYLPTEYEKASLLLGVYNKLLKKEAYDISDDYLFRALEIFKKIDKNLYKRYYLDYVRLIKRKEGYKRANELLSEYEKDLEGELLRDAYILHARIFKKKDLEKNAYYLQKAFELSIKLGELEKAYELLRELEYVKAFVNYEDNLKKLLYEYEKKEDLVRFDNVLGYIIEYYKDLGKHKETKEFYLKQIELRKKFGDLFKLEKGYKYFGDYLQKIGEYDLAEEYYKKALEVAVNLHSSDLIEYSTYSLLKFYRRKKNNEKWFEILKLREEYANKLDDFEFKLKALKDLEEFYFKNKKFKEALQIVNKELVLTPKDKFPIDRMEILERVLPKIEGKFYQKLLFDYLEVLLINKKIENAKNIFEGIKQLDKKVIINKSRAILRYLLSISEIKQYAVLFIWLGSLINSKFIKQELKFLRKNVKSRYILQIANFINEYDYELAVIFYYEYFDIRMNELSTQYELQEKLFEKIEDLIKNTQNKHILEKFYDRYERFKKRQQNRTIINNVVVDMALINPVKEVVDTFDKKNKEEVLNAFKKLISLLLESEIFIEKVKTLKAEISVLFRGFNVLVGDVNVLEFGFDDKAIFLNWLLNDTPLKMVRNKKTKIYYAVFENFNDENFEDVLKVKDYETYVHSTDNYAKLLSAMFFLGDGVFFPKNKTLQEKFYGYISKNEINKITFKNLFNKIVDELVIEDQNDKLRVENLIKNLYYANLLVLEDFYLGLEESRLSLNVPKEEVLDRVKIYAKEKLINLLGSVKEEHFLSLWV